ncbi:MAG TPA: hypothetical protein VJ792_01430 [Candidatus Nitrosotalea sp.]|nr:hypothetical protein [Candidatus Nitrosotalea sp.]
MLHFSKDDPEADLSAPLLKIKDLSSKIEQKISQKDKGGKDGFIETLSVEELKDLRQVILASEYLLTKYKDRLDLKAFLQDFVGIIMQAANSVNGMQGELEDLLISAEVALQQIQALHHDVTQNLALGKGVQTRIDDYRISQAAHEPVVGPVSEPVSDLPSPINLTNPSRRIHTNDYLGRTAVEI